MARGAAPWPAPRPGGLLVGGAHLALQRFPIGALDLLPFGIGGGGDLCVLGGCLAQGAPDGALLLDENRFGHRTFPPFFAPNGQDERSQANDVVKDQDGIVHTGGFDCLPVVPAWVQA